MSFEKIGFAWYTSAVKIVLKSSPSTVVSFKQPIAIFDGQLSVMQSKIEYATGFTDSACS